MSNYVNPLPRDKGSEALQEFPPAVRAITSVMMRENAIASSVMLLDPNATSIEVNAVGGQGIAIRWVALTETPAQSPRASVIASGLGANFDHMIHPGEVRKFAIPKETQGQLAGGQIGSVNGLYQRLAQINAGTTAASVLIVQY